MIYTICCSSIHATFLEFVHAKNEQAKNTCFRDLCSSKEQHEQFFNSLRHSFYLIIQ